MQRDPGVADRAVAVPAHDRADLVGRRGAGQLAGRLHRDRRAGEHPRLRVQRLLRAAGQPGRVDRDRDRGGGRGQQHDRGDPGRGEPAGGQVPGRGQPGRPGREQRQQQGQQPDREHRPAEDEQQREQHDEQVHLGHVLHDRDRVGAAQGQVRPGGAGEQQHLPGHPGQPGPAGADRPLGGVAAAQAGDQAEQRQPGQQAGGHDERRLPVRARVQVRARPQPGDQPAGQQRAEHGADRGRQGQLQHRLAGERARADAAGGQQPHLAGPPVGPVRPGRADQQQRQQGAAEGDRQHRAAQPGADQLGPVGEGGQLAGAAVGAAEVERHRQAGGVVGGDLPVGDVAGPADRLPRRVDRRHPLEVGLALAGQPDERGRVGGQHQRRRHVVGRLAGRARGSRTSTSTPAAGRRRSCGSSRPAGPARR